MRRRAAFAVVASLLLAGEAAARSCRPTVPEPVPDVVQQVWRDAAEFAFLIGRDLISDDGAMTLATRLRGMSEFQQLRDAASRWGAVQRRIHDWAEALNVLDVLVNQLEGFCDQLDAVSLDPAAPLDEAAWMAGMARLERGLRLVSRATEGLVSELQHYAALLRAAAAHHARQGGRANPVIRIGPEPDNVAAAISEIAARWRAQLSDLATADALIPVLPERQSVRPIINITAAMTAILRAVAGASAVSRHRLSDGVITRYETGQYLYDQCPMIGDGQWVALVNMQWANKGVMGLGGGIAVSDLAHPPGAGGMDRWQFTRIGLGYWMIRHGVDRPTTAALDIRRNAVVSFPLTLSPTDGDRPRASGQYWRCAATDRPNSIRLYNLHLSEARVVDTPHDTPQANMADAGPFETQYWRVLPR